VPSTIAADMLSRTISSTFLIWRASSIVCCPSRTVRPADWSAKSIGSSATSSPRGMSATPCFSRITLISAAARWNRPASGATEPRKPTMPARQCSRGSHGAYSRWWTAAEPKSQSQGSPSPASSAKRHILSRDHSPITVLVR
jgi:hypothetical protein